MTIAACMEEVRRLAVGIGRTVRLMEVCGTHTVSAFRTGLRSLLPGNVKLISGPGCPVCVTPNEYVDRVVAIAESGALITTFGDMLRVPGSRFSLEEARARGGEIAMVYSPGDALRMAKENPDRAVVFLGVGFETTTPTVAWTLLEAREQGLMNFSVLSAHKTIPGPMEALLESGESRIDGFLCPGHVSVIIGSDAYAGMARKHGVPCVVAGFEAIDMAESIRMLLAQLADGGARVEVQYRRSVTRDGNAHARQACETVFEPADARWRGIGVIPGSGLAIRKEFKAHDADLVFSGVRVEPAAEPPGCRCGEVLRGVLTPPECGLFGRACTPARPVGPCMVSSEGTCAAYHRYWRREPSK